MVFIRIQTIHGSDIDHSELPIVCLVDDAEDVGQVLEYGSDQVDQWYVGYCSLDL